MENIRRYCEYIDLYFQLEPDQGKQDKYIIEKNKCLDAVSNKLLSMDDTNKKYYAKMIADYFENVASINFDLLNAFLPDNDEIAKNDIRKEIEGAGETATEEEITFVWERAKQRRTITDNATLCVAELTWNIAKLFACCNIDINTFFRVYFIPTERPTLSESTSTNLKSKTDKSTAKNQYGILSALIKASGYTIPDGKKFASFISWLCGGSAESIRQNVCCKYDCGDENILKEKFASIGITYEDGKIKKRIETANL